MTKLYRTEDGDLVTEVQRIETMINSPQVRDMRSRTRETNGYVRPRNASTMILLDYASGEPKVLMGKRNKNLKFMPGALVFPGGSVDKADGSIQSADELSDKTRDRLVNCMRGRPTPRGARALGMAAVREVAEESGLLIGTPGTFSSSHQDWRDFSDAGIVPALSGLRLFARAITPPGMARRFDTFFFIANSNCIAHTPEGGFAPDGELEDLQWIRPEDAIEQNTREITRVMLVELMSRLGKDKKLSDTYPAPYYFNRGMRFKKDEI